MIRTTDSQGKTKYVGTSRAKVLDDRDPLSRGRVLVDHPLLGPTSWIPYLNTPGNFSTPAIGDLVYVQCESGEPEYAYAWGNVTKGSKSEPNIPSNFKRTVPTNRGFFTPGGHFLEMDDGEAKSGSDPSYKQLSTKNRGIRITSSSGHKIHIADDSENQVSSITILDKEGDGVVFDAKNKQVSVVSKGKLSVLSEDTMTITSNKDLKIDVPNDQELHTVKSFNVQADQFVQLQGDQVTVTGQSQATFSGDSQTTVGSSSSPTNVNGQQVMLAGGGAGVARLGDRVISVGNLGMPATGTIIQGSTKVLSG